MIDGILTYEQAISFEQSLIGCILIEPDVVLSGLSAMIPKLAPEDFQITACRAVFESATDLWLAQEVTDATTITDAARKAHPEMENLSQLVFEAMQVTPTTANWQRYARGVLELSRSRRLDDLAHRILDAATLEEKDAIVAQMHELNAPDTGPGEVSWMDGLRACYERIGNPKTANFIRWGMDKLNENLMIRPGGFVILGGFASSGKTALGTQFALRFAQDGHNVGIYSLETDDETLFDRMIAQISGANFDRIQHRRAVEQDYQAVLNIVQRTKDMKLRFVSAAGWTAEQIQAHAMARRFDVIIVDYIQLVESSAPNRAEEVARVSRSFHAFAQKTHTTVLGLSQLTPGDHFPPTMNDLRESRQLSQDADAVLILYEPREEGAQETDRVLKIAKNKQGKRGTIDLELDVTTMRMEPPPQAPPDYDDEEDEEPSRRRHQGARSKQRR